MQYNGNRKNLNKALNFISVVLKVQIVFDISRKLPYGLENCYLVLTVGGT